MPFKQLPRLYRVAKIDMCIWLVSFICTVVFNVRDGLIMSIGFALITTVFRQQRPPNALLGRLPDTDIYENLRRHAKIMRVGGVRIFRFDAPLMFINVDLFRERLYDKCRNAFQA
jgi:MFS superfamily sulfate permease-like transporter